MKHIYLPIIFCFYAVALSAQTVVVEDHFDSYTIGQGIASQSAVWETFSNANGGGPDDALASNEHVLSAPVAMKIVNGKDMVYSFGDVSSGAYIIEFNIYLHEQGYFNLEHEQGENWAVDIYLTANNEIKYLDEDGSQNSQVIGTYVNDQWMHFQFTVDMDLDTILTYKDGVLLHSSNFSNSLDGAPSSHLDIMNFFGLAGFNGVTSSHYFIDDFKVTSITGLTAIDEQETDPTITIFPNPAKEVLTLNAKAALEQVIITDLSGKQVLKQELSGQQTQLSLSEFSPGVYIVLVKSETGTKAQRLTVH
jgi:hypothetical protein